jgi:hypothetical protein
LDTLHAAILLAKFDIFPEEVDLLLEKNRMLFPVACPTDTSFDVEPGITAMCGWEVWLLPDL